MKADQSDDNPVICRPGINGVTTGRSAIDHADGAKVSIRVRSARSPRCRSEQAATMPVALANEDGQPHQRHRIRHAQRPGHEAELDCALHDQLHAGNVLRFDGQVPCQPDQMVRDDVAGVLDQLGAGQPGNGLPDDLPVGQQQCAAAEQLRQSSQPLSGMPASNARS
jgi:hypothetical protein